MGDCLGEVVGSAFSDEVNVGASDVLEERKAPPRRLGDVQVEDLAARERCGNRVIPLGEEATGLAPGGGAVQLGGVDDAGRAFGEHLHGFTA